MIELPLDPHANKTGDIWHISFEVVLDFHFLLELLFFLIFLNKVHGVSYLLNLNFAFNTFLFCQ